MGQQGLQTNTRPGEKVQLAVVGTEGQYADAAGRLIVVDKQFLSGNDVGGTITQRFIVDEEFADENLVTLITRDSSLPADEVRLKAQTKFGLKNLKFGRRPMK